MTVAIMQPYVFPYIGYFQLINAVDTFVFYDNVDYIQRGWINRNRIQINKIEAYFTVPVVKSKLGAQINTIEILNYNAWKLKFLKTIELSYKKAPYFEITFSFINKLLNKKDFTHISDLSIETVKTLSKFLDIETNFKVASELDLDFNSNVDKENKIEQIMETIGAKEIIMPPGSFELYKNWKPDGIVKRTMELNTVTYNQRNPNFIENLSIIDLMMFNSLDELKELINKATLV